MITTINGVLLVTIGTLAALIGVSMLILEHQKQKALNAILNTLLGKE